MKVLVSIVIGLLVVGCGKKNSREPQTKTPETPQADVNATTTQVTGGSPAPLLPATKVATAAPAPEPIAGKQKPLTKEESAEVIELQFVKLPRNPQANSPRRNWRR